MSICHVLKHWAILDATLVPGAGRILACHWTSLDTTGRMLHNTLDAFFMALDAFYALWTSDFPAAGRVFNLLDAFWGLSWTRFKGSSWCIPALSICTLGVIMGVFHDHSHGHALDTFHAPICV